MKFVGLFTSSVCPSVLYWALLLVSHRAERVWRSWRYPSHGAWAGKVQFCWGQHPISMGCCWLGNVCAGCWRAPEEKGTWGSQIESRRAQPLQMRGFPHQWGELTKLASTKEGSRKGGLYKAWMEGILALWGVREWWDQWGRRAFSFLFCCPSVSP